METETDTEKPATLKFVVLSVIVVIVVCILTGVIVLR